MEEFGKRSKDTSIADYGLGDVKAAYWNLDPAELTEDTILNGQGFLTDTGALAIDTGEFTGRSPKDKYILKDETTETNLWWTSDTSKNDNKPIDKNIWDKLYKIVSDQLSHKKLYVVDAICGANNDSCLKVRFVMEVAWQAHFVKNMFYKQVS